MKYWLLLFCLIPLYLSAQLTDDFSDGDFTTNPAWLGDQNDFIVNSAFQLQLNAAEAGTSHLTTSFEMSAEMEWRFWIRMNFAPSDNNLARVYLASSILNLEAPLNGYFLKFGENLSNDAIELYRQNGETTTLICRGSDGLIASSFQLWIRVRRDVSGTWTIERDNAGFGAYQTDATGTDNQIPTASFIGVYCKYTSSNAKNFYFDQFYVGPVVVDNEAPQLVRVEALSANNLDVIFNEALQPSSAVNLLNYFVSNNIEYPKTATLDSQNPGKVRLVFDRPFPVGVTLSISIQNIADINGNVASLIQTDFSWYLPSAFDIQINEIMADPDPPVNLPNAEYIELLNTTGNEINLSGWNLITGSTARTFGEIILQPGGFLLVGHENSAAELSEFGPYYGFSGFQLANAGQNITLKNQLNQVITNVTYSDAWYQNSNKKNGGWSLEQIDPANPCGGSANWIASVNPAGGTPGAPNSVIAANPDIIDPYALRVEVLSSSAIIVNFSEPMDSTFLNQTQTYKISPSVGFPIFVAAIEPDYLRVAMNLDPSNSLSQDIIYTLEILNDLADCAGNLIDKSRKVNFGIPKPVLANDIIINEILFNPKEDIVKGVDFVEIYNRSDKILDLSTLILATVDKITNELSTPKNISESGLLLFPESFMVLTTDPEVVRQQYFTENPEAFVTMASLPQFNNTDGVAVIATKGFEVIDRMAYTEEMHYPLLKSVKGVSLERINPGRPSTDNTNWHSAAEDAGFATPGYKNSQYSEEQFIDDPITLQPEIFSPDMDGRDDVLNIAYQFENPGFVANITIYDSRGRLARKLVQNELLGAEGSFSWDGITDDGQKAAIGIYIIFFEVFDTSGSLKKYKKTAVLGGRL